MPQKHHDKKTPAEKSTGVHCYSGKEKINPNASPTMAKEFGFIVFGSGIGIRTPTNRVRVCRATVTQFR